MARRAPSADIRAAGGVVWQPGEAKVEVAIIHRPRYDDWSLPKGKLEPDEVELIGAVREVAEELGSQVAVSRRIGTVTYPTPAGLKAVTYWVMRRVGGTFVPNAEVDAVKWLRARDARDQLSYDVDRRIMSEFIEVPIPDSMILLVRHAKAGKRTEWRGSDRDRPLEPAGESQAARLATLLALFRPDRIISADLARCVETVRPLADRLGLPVIIDPVFGDEAYIKAPAATEDALLALAKPGHVTVVCSQGQTIPGLIERLGRGVLDSETRKGAFWALSVVDGTVVSMDYYDDAVR
ncbi:MAG TPA: NUDIX hydrolase [Jatrophihabitans sp.]|nr:NUDIX hydrolase [Jatrophihabitans sp.]